MLRSILRVMTPINELTNSTFSRPCAGLYSGVQDFCSGVTIILIILLNSNEQSVFLFVTTCSGH